MGKEPQNHQDKDVHKKIFFTRLFGRERVWLVKSSVVHLHCETSPSSILMNPAFCQDQSASLRSSALILSSGEKTTVKLEERIPNDVAALTPCENSDLMPAPTQQHCGRRNLGVYWALCLYIWAQNKEPLNEHLFANQLRTDFRVHVTVQTRRLHQKITSSNVAFRQIYIQS